MSASDSTNQTGQVGFAFSLLGCSGTVLTASSSHTVSVAGTCLAMFCLPGLLISLVGLRWAPRRRSIWGVALGSCGSAYLLIAELAFPLL